MPWQCGQFGSPSNSLPVSAADEFADLLFNVSLASCLIVSSILLRATTLFLPSLQDCFAIAPAALVVPDRELDRLVDPLHRIRLLRVFQCIGDERGERANVLLVLAEDVRPLHGCGGHRGPVAPFPFAERLGCSTALRGVQEVPRARTKRGHHQDSILDGVPYALLNLGRIEA